MKIKRLEEMITRLHKHAKISGQPSATDKNPASDPNMLSQVSSPPVPDRDGPVKSQFQSSCALSSSYLNAEQLHQGTPVSNRASEVGQMVDRAPRTPTRTVYPQEPEHAVLPRRTAMKPKGNQTADAIEEFVDSDDEFDEPIINALGKRDRLGGPRKRTDAKRDSSFEEAERPNKNRVSKGPLLVHSDKPSF